MPSGNFKPEPSRLCLRGCSKLEIGSWKLTEIELGKKKKKWIEVSRIKAEERKKKEKSKRALLADSEKCCKLTDLFLKSSTASASTNVSDTAEPAHQGERQDSGEYKQGEEQNEQEEDEEVDMDNEWR